MKSATVIVLLVLALMGACANAGEREYAPPPPPAKETFTPRPYLTPDPADGPIEDVAGGGDSDVYVSHDDDDDGESRFCQRRRWC